MNSVLRREPLNFAPVSGQNSTRLRIASGYFIVSGVLTLVLVALISVGLMHDPAPIDELSGSPWAVPIGLMIQVAGGLVWIWIGILLNRRSRRGGILAALFLLFVLIAALFPPVQGFSLVVSVIGLPILASVWNELS